MIIIWSQDWESFCSNIWAPFCLQKLSDFIFYHLPLRYSILVITTGWRHILLTQVQGKRVNINNYEEAVSTNYHCSRQNRHLIIKHKGLICNSLGIKYSKLRALAPAILTLWSISFQVSTWLVPSPSSTFTHMTLFAKTLPVYLI